MGSEGTRKRDKACLPKAGTREKGQGWRVEGKIKLNAFLYI
jgi:hypothetical protein